MNNTIIGRTQQTQELEEAIHSNKPEMIALVGRRRVGKTYLVREVYKGKIDFELTGLQYSNKKEQLQNFVFTLGKYFPDYELPRFPSSWLEAFHFLGEALEAVPKKEKLIVFLDELPWLGTKKSGFITGLGYFWNSWASKQNIVVVICGSAASWMIEKIINDRGGLHNRVTRLLYLYPFTLAETEAYCKSRNIKLNRFQILQLYMTMGGVPMYLDLLKKGQSAIQNIQNICFDSTGYLRNEFERLYASLFENHQNHIQIIRALSSKWRGLTRKEIIQLTKFKNGGMLSKLLEELDASGFITVYGGYDKKVKESLYRLTDAYSLFYLTYIEPLGKSSFTDFTQLSDLPKWKVWSGYAFESVCLNHIQQIRKGLSIAGIASSVASFIARPKDGLAGTQIDLLIDRNDQTINICEIKFSISNYEVTKKDVENIAIKKRVFQYHTKTKKHLFTTLITTQGVVQNSNRINYIDQVITLDELFL
ncbi:MAG: ATP-binding protein [Bacteroidota bacterium]